MTERTQIWNCGGGTQSTAIAVLIIQGILPKPDLAVIVDTERERSTTWEYLNRWTGPALKEAGVELHRVQKSQYATTDVWGGRDKRSLLIPAFTTESGEIGKLTGWCSNEWKKRVVQRWARQQGVTSACNWIGFSTDEKRRMAAPTDDAKWATRYVLAELGHSRADCYRIVDKFGWPTPPHSSCWMCPNHREVEWREIKGTPDFDKAVAFEREIQLIDPNVWLHSECKPLDQIDFDDKQNTMFGGCDSGMCFT